jgi:hypothetical protein
MVEYREQMAIRIQQPAYSELRQYRMFIRAT